MLIKYPKTMHLPWSPGLQNDDRMLENYESFVGREVVVTEKMDGENATLYRDHYHARSLDSRHHPSRDWIKAFHGSIKHEIPAGYRICGENLYAEHSIHYNELESYFMGFSFWNNYSNTCWNWNDTLEMFAALGITPVREWWRGQWEDFVANHDVFDNMVKDNVEGYVVRVIDDFHFDDFGTHVAKFVRKDHIQTDQHWMAKPVVPNGLKSV